MKPNSSGAVFPQPPWEGAMGRAWHPALLCRHPRGVHCADEQGCLHLRPEMMLQGTG